MCSDQAVRPGGSAPLKAFTCCNYAATPMPPGYYLHPISVWECTQWFKKKQKKKNSRDVTESNKQRKQRDSRSHLLSFALLLADPLRQSVLLHLHRQHGGISRQAWQHFHTTTLILWVFCFARCKYWAPASKKRPVRFTPNRFFSVDVALAST